MDLEFRPQVVRFLAGDAQDLDAVDEHGGAVDVDGLRAGVPEGVGAQRVADVGQFVRHLLGGLVAAAEHRVDGHGVETHHPVAGEVRLDAHVDAADVPLEGVLGEHVDAPPEDVGDVVDLLVAGLGVGQVHADDDVGAHLPGEVHREVVAHAAVHQHHATGADRGEVARDGHRGAHRRVEVAVVPDFRPAGDDVRRHAGERDRQAEEVRGIGIARREAGDQVLDVLAEDIAGRKAAHQALQHHPVGVAVAGREVQLAVRGIRVADVLL